MRIEDLFQDKDIMKVSHQAAQSFRGVLSEDEIKNCIDAAIWRASKKYVPNRGTKLTSYIHNGVVFECLSQRKNNTSAADFSIDRWDNGGSRSLSGSFNEFDRIDMMDEIAQCEDPMLIYDRFYCNMTIGELADLHGVCGETIRIRLRKNLKMIKNSLTGS